MIGTSGALRVLYEGEPEPRPGLFCYLLDDAASVRGRCSLGRRQPLRVARTHAARRRSRATRARRPRAYVPDPPRRRAQPRLEPARDRRDRGSELRHRSQRPLPGCAGRRDVPAGGDRRMGFRRSARSWPPATRSLRATVGPNSARMFSAARSPSPASRRARRAALRSTPSNSLGADPDACAARPHVRAGSSAAPRSTPKPGGASANSTTVCMYLDSYVTVLVH